MISQRNSCLLYLHPNYRFSILYLGEGFKKSPVTGLGNSDPLILRFFIFTLKKLYNIKPDQFSCHLHLRSDQDPKKMKIYWSQVLEIPLDRFKKESIDRRTVGIKTFNDYKGVCVIRCGNVAIQRKLVYLSRAYCERITSILGG